MTNRSGHRSPMARRGETPVVRQRIWLKPTMTITRLALIVLSTLAATVTLPATAHANFNDERFQSPSGDILCELLRDHNNWDPAKYGKGQITCQVQNSTYPVPSRQYIAADGQLSTCYTNGWGSLFSLPEGRPPHLSCVGASPIFQQPLPRLEYGQSISLGSITCASELSAMTCTDTSSGRFFRVSPDSYQLG
jgi:hypothetical protein